MSNGPCLQTQGPAGTPEGVHPPAMVHPQIWQHSAAAPSACRLPANSRCKLKAEAGVELQGGAVPGCRVLQQLLSRLMGRSLLPGAVGSMWMCINRCKYAGYSVDLSRTTPCAAGDGGQESELLTTMLTARRAPSVLTQRSSCCCWPMVDVGSGV